MEDLQARLDALFTSRETTAASTFSAIDAEDIRRAADLAAAWGLYGDAWQVLTVNGMPLGEIPIPPDDRPAEGDTVTR